MRIPWNSLLFFLDGKSLCALVSSCKQVSLVLSRTQGPWKRLYELYNFRVAPRLPRLPQCGSWRQAVIRASNNTVSLYIRPLGANQSKLKFVVKRGITLYGVKRLVRNAQLEKYGIALDDFELVDCASCAPLGVQGYDSLPPADLGVLFPYTDSLLSTMNSNPAFWQMFYRNQRNAWRENLLLIEDGVEFLQVFVGKHGVLQGIPDMLEVKDDTITGNPEEDHGNSQAFDCCNTLTSLASGNLARLVCGITGPMVTRGKRWDMFYQLCDLLSDANSKLGYNSYKAYWHSSKLHPLLHIATRRFNRVPFRLRVLAMLQFAKGMIHHLLSLSFAINACARGLIGSGFLAIFSRLIVRIFPFLFRTQVQQLLDGEVDWIPLVFAVKFLLRSSVITLVSVGPILKYAFVHQLIRVVMRSVLVQETGYDDNVVYLLMVLLSRVSAFKWKMRFPRVAVKLLGLNGQNHDMDGSYARFSTSLKKRIRLSFQSRLPRLAQFGHLTLGLIAGKPLVQYLISAIAWDLVTPKLSDSLSISIPVYAYSVPCLVTALLIRLRMALSDGYYYLLYI
mmetsp:Transcript_12369/g.22416  ORF Transcript_12369/g.22416 Transcript_12369/m.22416 type:complete len:563 (+) Transcript_12369:403-2091(+)